MQLDEILTLQGPAILEQAVAVVHRRGSSHYAQLSDEVLRARLGTLLELTTRAVESRDLSRLLEYVRGLAEERFRAGYGLGEVQTALNVLEEALWERAVVQVPPEDLAVALALCTTALGEAKDCLARTYVNLASQVHAPALNQPALFDGPQSAPAEL